MKKERRWLKSAIAAASTEYMPLPWAKKRSDLSNVVHITALKAALPYAGQAQKTYPDLRAAS